MAKLLRIVEFFSIDCFGKSKQKISTFLASRSPLNFKDIQCCYITFFKYQLFTIKTVYESALAEAQNIDFDVKK